MGIPKQKKESRASLVNQLENAMARMILKHNRVIEASNYTQKT